jgi:hypothetical protein
MHIALYTGRKVIIDDLSYTSEVHTSSHNFRTDHYPALASAHASYSIFSLLFAHPCMEAIHIRDPVYNEFFW